jgi:hypothetical protein
MEGRPRVRVVEVQAPSRAFARGVPDALARLGYELVRRGGRRGDRAPEVRIVCARDLRAALRGEGRAPLIVIEAAGGRRARGARGERVVASLRKPAELGDLFRALQRALEQNPRRFPRVPTALPARCVARDADWPGAIVSLSEGGCLLRSARARLPRERMRVWFPLPETGLLEVRARPVHREGSRVGLAFEGLAEETRSAIAGYVAAELGC